MSIGWLNPAVAVAAAIADDVSVVDAIVITVIVVVVALF